MFKSCPNIIIARHLTRTENIHKIDKTDSFEYAAIKQRVKPTKTRLKNFKYFANGAYNFAFVLACFCKCKTREYFYFDLNSYSQVNCIVFLAIQQRIIYILDADY